MLNGQSTTSLTMADGLSQGMVIDLLQDSKGFLWIGTLDGLNRYNGYEIDVFHFIPDAEFSLSDHGINFVYEDSRGLIWVATFSGGVNVFDPTSERFYQIFHRKNSGIQSNHVLKFNEDSEGNIWVGSLSGLDLILNPSDWDFSTFKKGDITDLVKVKPLISGTIVNDIFFSKKKIWIAAGEQIFSGKSAEDLRPFEKVDFQSGLSKLQNQILRIVFDRYDNLWLKRAHSLTAVTKDTVIHHTFGMSENLGIMGMITDKEGNFILGGPAVVRYRPQQNGGLIKVDKLIELPAHYQANKLYQDRSGLLWVSTAGYGLKKYNLTRSRFGHLLESETVRYINEDADGRIFVSGRAGLHVIDKDFKQPIRPDHIPEELLQSNNMIEDGDGVYWFILKGDQNSNVLTSWDPLSGKSQKFFLSHNIHYLSFMIEDELDFIWMSSEDEKYLLRFDKKSGKNTYFNLSEYLGVGEGILFLTHLVHHGGKKYWVSSSHGLLRLEIIDDEIKTSEWFGYRPGDPYSLGSNYIFHFHFDPNEPEVIWLATRGGGLNKLNSISGLVERITTEDGLPNNVVYSVLPHSGNLWMSTNRGLSNYNPLTGTFANYSPAEGLQNFEYNFTSHRKLRDGRLAFGGVNGINVFNPDEIELNNTIPKVEITQLRVNNKKINPSFFHSPKKFHHQENTIFLSFASLDFNDPSKNKYQYKLEGVDKEWIASGSNREVTYANLPPGSYKFRVMGTNNSGLWSDEEAVFEFVILSPWWKTNSAYLLYFLVTGTIIFFIVRFQRNRMKIQNQLKLEKMEKERLEKLDRIKTNFFDNITHEFKSPLTLIIEPLRKTIPKVKDQRILMDLKTAERSSHQLLNLIDQLLELSRLESGELQLRPMPGNIIRDLEKTVSAFSGLAEKNRVDLKVIAPNKIVTVEYDQQALQKIINNLVSNAVKFTPTGGSVNVSIKLSESGSKDQCKLQIIVRDNGIGMNSEELEKVFDRFFRAESVRQKEGTGIGLPIAKELTELMGGSLAANSVKGKGTTFRLTLPLKKAKTTSAKDGFEGVVSNDQISTKVAEPASSLLKNGIRENNQPIDKKVILVTEDNPEIRHFISDIFTGNFEVLEAGDGTEGLQTARQRIPDLIISDWMMPNSSGLDFCKAIKSNDLTSHIPFVLLTAKSSISSKVRGLQAMADAYVSKPFHSGELLALVESLIANREVALKKLQSATLEQFGFGEISKELDKLNTDPFIQKVDKFLQENLANEDLKVEDIAAELFISRMQLHRKIKGVAGQTSSEYIRNFRLKQGYFLLTNSDLNVNEVAMRVGISNRNYFSRTFKDKYGVSPSEVRKKTDINP